MAVAHGVSALFLSAMMFYFIQTSIIVSGSVVSKDHSCGRDDDFIALSNYNMEVVFFKCFPLFLSSSESQQHRVLCEEADD